MRISDWSSDVCSSDLAPPGAQRISVAKQRSRHTLSQEAINALVVAHVKTGAIVVRLKGGDPFVFGRGGEEVEAVRAAGLAVEVVRSEEHTYELQSLMRSSYAVFCLQTKITHEIVR